jgi:hypothetical protein
VKKEPVVPCQQCDDWQRQYFHKQHLFGAVGVLWARDEHVDNLPGGLSSESGLDPPTDPLDKDRAVIGRGEGFPSKMLTDVHLVSML